MERINSVSVKIEIDTNKATYSETFTDMQAAVFWWNDRAEELGVDGFALDPIVLAACTCWGAGVCEVCKARAAT